MAVLYRILYFSYMDLDKPEGYSKETAEAILQRYDYSGEAEAQKDDTSEGAIVPDDILVIMNESWADLSCAGDFETNIPYNEFYTNLTENTIKGTACVSIYGGNTPQSEYEFLTGNTISFLPSGAIAYNLYIKRIHHRLFRSYQSRDMSVLQCIPRRQRILTGIRYIKAWFLTVSYRR